MIGAIRAMRRFSAVCPSRPRRQRSASNLARRPLRLWGGIARAGGGMGMVGGCVMREREAQQRSFLCKRDRNDFNDLMSLERHHPVAASAVNHGEVLLRTGKAADAVEMLERAVKEAPS